MARQALQLGKHFETTVPFSLGVVWTGRTLQTAGITARNANGDVVGAGDMRAQVTQIFANLADILTAAGASFEKVVKFTIFTTDIHRFNVDTSDIRLAYFKGRPAATLVEVSKLVDPRMLVEIEAIVCLD
ncbi:enamine deaminase RidA (YjgF/YER057c/UK114 family) [Afipia massiliensis]|uniref:Enamine deaminase RidA (YjgF/YER057c/UK114 family) n=1 Tax=Afipia massiliensis TaxID=211460 RepID=A0A840N7H1_9BRAD|nr:RidA family protein [Afipia massiliensis]MBB5055130.1 enamine deaminase RidA (YjgF/YER057c/UK114 family) [Afipia massiliensis]